MKTERGTYQRMNREHAMGNPGEDSYRADRKLPEPTVCPKCHSTYHKGRWTWQKAPPKAHEHLCPACLRIHDDFPAGYVTLKGKFTPERRAEIVSLVKEHEAKAKGEHPLQRIIAVETVVNGILITTTDSHLARSIAHVAQSVLQGELKLYYNKEENLLRAVLTR